MKKYLILVASTFALAGAGLGFGTFATANAQPAPATSTVRHGFRLSRGDRKQDLRGRLQARLNQAVRDGTITSAQRQAFLSEFRTLSQQERSSLKSATTKTERQAARQTFRDGLKAWADANNFPLAKILPRLAS